MKKKLPYIIMISLTVLFIAFTAGYLLGSTNSVQPPYSDDDAVTFDNISTDAQIYDNKININTADIDMLMLLDGIGEALANRIIDYRNEHGPFSTIDEIMNVSGIGNKKFNSISEFITTGG